MQPPSPSPQEQPQLWLGPSSLLDLEDPKLRLRVHALTQLCKTEREKALAVYGFVKRMPLARLFKLRVSTARQVLDAGRGDAADKATLLVAMLRTAGLPARLRWVALHGEMLRGLATGMRSAQRPLVEVWLNGRWARTDTYIFDAAYMAAARQRLKDSGWTWGWGIHVEGAMIWNGCDDAFVGGCPTGEDSMVLADLGVWHDPLDFMRSRAYRERHGRLARLLHWNVVAPVVQRGIRRLREGQPAFIAPEDRTRRPTAPGTVRSNAAATSPEAIER